MNDPGLHLLHRGREQPQQAARSAGGGHDARYRIAPRLETIADESGGILFSWRPFMAIRLNTAAFRLVSAMSGTDGRTAAELAARIPSLSRHEAAAFLDGLARRRLLIREPATPTRWPSVSIIVAAYGRPDATRACVQSLLAQDYPGEQIEILVADDASDPPLAPALSAFPINVMRLDRNVGQSAARNLAAAEAGGELLAFIDNDCTASPTWLRELVPYLHDRDYAIVGGRTVAREALGAVAAFEAVRSPLDMEALQGPVGPREAIAYLPTCNLLVRRDAFFAAGGFAVEMRVGEDVDFIWRALEHGAPVHYAAGGVVVHDHRVRLGALLRRRADYGSSEADLQRRHPQHGRTMTLPCTGLLALASLTAFGVAWPAGAVLALLALATVVGELLGKRRRLRKMGMAVGAQNLVAPLLREHAASLYHLGCEVTRYYGLPLLAIGASWPPLLTVIAFLLLVGPICDHRRRKPALSLPAFIGLYWLEMASYQLGVWLGCLKQRCWRPLFPRIRWRL